MLNNLKSAPAAARWLGFAGLIPFAVAAVAGFFPGAPFHDAAVEALLSYGAIILSFLGGIRWGLSILKLEHEQLWAPLSFSVMPALMGWMALLMPDAVGLLLLALGLVGQLLADLRLPLAPPWYAALRLPLSVGAVAALLLGLLI